MSIEQMITEAIGEAFKKLPATKESEALPKLEKRLTSIEKMLQSNLLTLKQASEKYNISEVTLRRACVSNALPHLRDGERLIKIRECKVIEYMEKLEKQN